MLFVARYLTSTLLLMKASSVLSIVYPLKILCLGYNFGLCNLVPRATNTILTFAPVTGGRFYFRVEYNFPGSEVKGGEQKWLL